METNQLAGLISVILGVLFIIIPVFSQSVISSIIGLNLLFFGIICIYMGLEMKHPLDNFSYINIVLGLISAILGFMFLFYLEQVHFLIDIQCFIVGIIMILFAVSRLTSNIRLFSKATSLLILIIGILALCVGIFANNNPLYVTMLLGLWLVIEGLGFLIEI